MSSPAVTEKPTVIISTKPTLVIPSPELLTLSPKTTPTPLVTPFTKAVPASSETAKGEDSEEEGFRPATDEAKVQRRSSGVCKWYSTVKGYGFICPQDDGEDVFVHQTAINVSGFRSLQDGESVEFEFYIDDNGRRRARNVTGPKGSPVVGQPASRTSFQRDSQVSNASGAAPGTAILPMGYPMQMMAAPVGAAYPYGAAAAAGQPVMMAADPMGQMRVSGRASMRASQVQRTSNVQDMAMPYMTMDVYGNTYFVDQSGMQRMSMMQPMQPVMEYAPAAPLVAQPEFAAPQPPRRNSAFEKRRSSLKQHQRRSIPRTSASSAESFKRNNFRRESAGNENSPRFANHIRASLVIQARAQR